jgi:hypothetical protein
MKAFQISPSVLCKWIIFWMPLITTAFTAASYKYLDSLNRGNSDSDDSTFGMPAEEYYGLTNPMANSWAGSKHEDYGGYLKRLGDKGGQRSSMPSRREAPDEWYGKSNPMASWQGYRHPQFGGYLDSLSKNTDEGSSSI